MMPRIAGLILATVACVTSASAQDNAPVPPSTERRITAPVPATLAGARVLSTADAEAIWRAKAGIFIDVLLARQPQNLRGHGLARQAAVQHSRQRLVTRHRLPKVGGGDRGLPSPWIGPCVWWQSCRAARDLLPGGLLDVLDAARQILSYGYRNVAWYPDGTDGWERAGLPLSVSQPEPRVGEEMSTPR